MTPEFLSTCNTGKTVFLFGQHFLSSDCGVLSYFFNFSFSLNDLMKGINVAFSSCYSSSSQPFSHPSMSAYPPIPSWQGCHRGCFPRPICSHQKLSEAENSVKDWNGKEEEKRSKKRGRNYPPFSSEPVYQLIGSGKCESPSYSFYTGKA